MIQAQSCQHNLRNERDKSQVDPAYPGDLGKNVIQVIRGTFARPDTWNKPALLTHVVGYFVGVINNREIEMRKKHDQDDVADRIQGLAPGKQTHEPFNGLADGS